MNDVPDPERFGMPAGLLLGLALFAQLACWVHVVTTDGTPLVDDSGELYRLALIQSQGLTEGDGRPLPPLLGHILGHWLELLGQGRLQVQLAALTVYLCLIGLTWQLGARLGGPRAAFLSAILATVLPGMIGPSRYLIPDQPAALWVALLALMLFDSRGAQRWPPLLLGGLLVGSAMLVKVSMVCYLAPLAGWFLYQLLREKTHRLRLAATLLIALCVCLPWYLRSGSAAAGFYLADPASSSSATWGMRRLSADYLLYYPRVLWYELAGPLRSTVLCLGLVAAARIPRCRGWLGYVLAVLVLLSCSPFRVPRYAFGLLPLLAALAGTGLATLLPRPRPTLLVGGLIALYGAGWSTSVLLGGAATATYPPLAYHRLDNLHGEDLAGIGLFAPRPGPWGGSALAAHIAAAAGPRSRILVIGTRPMGFWDVRLRLLEDGLDLPFEIPRMLPGTSLAHVLPAVTMVLISDYSTHERDFRRRNMWPLSPDEFRRRGYPIEVQAERWFFRQRAQFVLVSRTITPDGKYIALYLRK